MTDGRIAELGLPWIPVRIQDRAGGWQLLRVVLDTGFTGELALPERFIRRLGLAMDNETRVTPATGQPVTARAGAAQIMWQGRPRRVRVVEAGNNPLLGMRLLRNHHIAIDAVPGGAVTVIPLAD